MHAIHAGPGYITYPTPSISGSAALPSTVDLLVNNRRQETSALQPGPFDLTNVPVVTGAGQMQLIVRDLLGRETVINQNYYLAPALLSPGLSDFSYEAGSLREQYGTRSNGYGAAFGAGTYRLGLTDALTAEVRGERSAAAPPPEPASRRSSRNSSSSDLRRAMRRPMANTADITSPTYSA